MFSEPVCQVARSWVEAVSFHAFIWSCVFRPHLRSGISGYTLVYVKYRNVGLKIIHEIK
jgi:hypothetical protein